jgi:hypothetical protein
MTRVILILILILTCLIASLFQLYKIEAYEDASIVLMEQVKKENKVLKNKLSKAKEELNAIILEKQKVEAEGAEQHALIAKQVKEANDEPAKEQFFAVPVSTASATLPLLVLQEENLKLDKEVKVLTEQEIPKLKKELAAYKAVPVKEEDLM